MNAPIATTAGRTLPTRLLRSALAALVLLAAWLGVPLSASAHAQLVSTSPQGGSLLDAELRSKGLLKSFNEDRDELISMRASLTTETDAIRRVISSARAR